jgi:hypothetical protein
MVQVGGVTYRIERSAPHCYGVVRLLDDCQVGTFQTRPTLRITNIVIEPAVFRDVIRAALRGARTSGVMHAAPVYVAPPSAAAPQVEDAQRRPPSTFPPPSPALV